MNRIKKLKQKIGKPAIVQITKSMAKSLWYTIEIVRCSECHRKYPAFNFEILYMWPNPEDSQDKGVCYCRKCYNKIVASPEANELWEDYYQHFNPVKDFITHLQWNWNWCVKRALEDIKYRKIRNPQVIRHD